MEWVETTGKTIEEAQDAALDQLGVDEQDAEFEILEEPRTGLFGRTRGDARVRARVRPTQPRPKVERRDRKGRGRPRTSDDVKSDGTPDAPAAVAVLEDEGPTVRSGPDKRPGGRNRSGATRRDRVDHNEESKKLTETELLAHGQVVRTFLLDLLDAFGLDGEVDVAPAEEGAVELSVTGGDLGLLIGPKGQTLQAIQELSRSVLQRQLPGETHARVRVDVSGYRQRRREALERFVRQIAEEVRSSGTQKALEPMSPPDRKVVHDTVNEIAGVHTVSQGEDDRRRVVILSD